MNSRIKSSHVFKCDKLKDQIKKCFDLDISTDSYLVHSTTICRNCFTQMRHFKSGDISENTMIDIWKKC